MVACRRWPRPRPWNADLNAANSPPSNAVASSASYWLVQVGVVARGCRGGQPRYATRWRPASQALAERERGSEYRRRRQRPVYDHRIRDVSRLVQHTYWSPLPTAARSAPARRQPRPATCKATPPGPVRRASPGASSLLRVRTCPVKDGQRSFASWCGVGARRSAAQTCCCSHELGAGEKHAQYACGDPPVSVTGSAPGPGPERDLRRAGGRPGVS